MDGEEAAWVQGAQSGGEEPKHTYSPQDIEEEAAWVQSAQSGSEKALSCLIGRHYHAVYAYFYKNTGQYHHSMDLTQEVFVKAALAIGRYRPRASFQSWLFAIASNHLKNYYRSLSRRPREQELLQEAVREPAAASAESAAEQKSDLAGALAKLPAAQKEALLLRFYHDFSVKEIAKITSVPQATVKARIRYGLAKLKKELGGIV